TLIAHFEHIKKYYPLQAETRRFLSLLAQVQRLIVAVSVEKRDYTKAMDTAKEMLTTAEGSGNPLAITYAYIEIGDEHDRALRYSEAIEALEMARDVSFQASKRVAARANMVLARAYASSNDIKRYERAIDTALNLANYLGDKDQSTEDFIF